MYPPRLQQPLHRELPRLFWDLLRSLSFFCILLGGGGGVYVICLRFWSRVSLFGLFWVVWAWSAELFNTGLAEIWGITLDFLVRVRLRFYFAKNDEQSCNLLAVWQTNVIYVCSSLYKRVFLQFIQDLGNEGLVAIHPFGMHFALLLFIIFHVSDCNQWFSSATSGFVLDCVCCCVFALTHYLIWSVFNMLFDSSECFCLFPQYFFFWGGGWGEGRFFDGFIGFHFAPPLNCKILYTKNILFRRRWFWSTWKR